MTMIIDHECNDTEDNGCRLLLPPANSLRIDTINEFADGNNNVHPLSSVSFQVLRSIIIVIITDMYGGDVISLTSLFVKTICSDCLI